MSNQIVWFDIPVTNLNRAIQFYSRVLGVEVAKNEFSGNAIGVFPHEGNEVGGCLFFKEGETPSDHGPLLYFNAQDRLDQAIAEVEPNGGRILQPKHEIGPYGWRAVVVDSEGNRIALHTM